MIQHISIRVPWHDNGWNGNVCICPQTNSSCLRLRNIYENKDDARETEICGQCMADYVEELSCISEGAAFMSPIELKKKVINPYKKFQYETHSHFLETEQTYPPYSFPVRPFAWMMKENVKYLSDIYNIDYDESIEPLLKFTTSWVQEAKNHRAIFDVFYKNVIEDKSLCIAYAKQVPFVEDSRRVIVGMGHVKKVIPAVEHNHTNDKDLRSMTWETMVCHSIREDHEDGFVIPYHKMMEYAETHPDFDITSIAVFAPDDAFNQFSYASEHVDYDSTIDVILSCIKSFEIINECLDEDYSNVLVWLNNKLSNVWEERGAFPGLGPVLCAFGISLGMVMAMEITDNYDEKCDFWDYIDLVFANPENYLSEAVATTISLTIRKTWETLPDNRKNLFKLLSRFALSIDQACVFFNEDERKKYDVNCTDLEIIENPYLLYEKTRLKNENLFISVKKVDRAIFPVKEIQEKYPLAVPTRLDSPNDERRIRAIAVAVLEDSAVNGNTILPCEMLIAKMKEITLKPKCIVTTDIVNAICDFMSPEIIKREMKNGNEYYKLVRINEFDEVIEKRIRKRINAPKIEVVADWKKLVDDEFNKIVANPTETELKAREEKTAVLHELAKSRISVLLGTAGTGKTTVLSILCNEPSIKAGGVLLLAPTGKATVRLKESMGENAKQFDAMNVAQFLVRSGHFDWDDMRYKLSPVPYKDVPETVIIDEASMLTEEMFGALIQTLGTAKRIIFVGDQNQLPPIGAGRPFMDLVSLLKMKLPANLNGKPKVCDCYGELTITRRQNTDKTRLDVNLAKVFTDVQEASEDGIISEILLGNTENIRFEKWETREELEKKLLDILCEVADMESVDDQDGFDKSLGATFAGYTYFNTGCAEHADKWQILAPVRNMPQGVMNMNRLIHLKYRENYVELSKKSKYRKIPKAFGPENIVYGDKVINVINNSRDAYPQDGALNYVANGEVGIACGGFGSSANHNFLHVEFSSQKGYSYSYTGAKDFGEENGSATLELAYALTVHKSQGSQFDTVIFVLAEPCRLISREMLYTALTRQKNKVIILYNNDPYHILKYSSVQYSDIARRFTDLFANVFEDGTFKPNIVKVGEQFFEDRLIHRTARGELVRSKSEVIIADRLYAHGLDYTYEPELELESKIKRPDFSVIDGDTGIKWYWEHCGMMSDPTYKRNWEDKKEFYKKNGIVEGKNLIVTYDDEKGGLDSYEIDQIIIRIFDL